MVWRANAACDAWSLSKLNADAHSKLQNMPNASKPESAFLLNGMPTGGFPNACKHHWHGELVCPGLSECMVENRGGPDSGQPRAASLDCSVADSPTRLSASLSSTSAGVFVKMLLGMYAAGSSREGLIPSLHMIDPFEGVMYNAITTRQRCDGLRLSYHIVPDAGSLCFARSHCGSERIDHASGVVLGGTQIKPRTGFSMQLERLVQHSLLPIRQRAVVIGKGSQKLIKSRQCDHSAHS